MKTQDKCVLIRVKSINYYGPNLDIVISSGLGICSG